MRFKLSNIIFYLVFFLIFGLVSYLIYSGNHKDVSFSSGIFNTENTQSQTANIEDLTREDKVISYLKENHQLPAYYITKAAARKLGWKPEAGNLCEVLPGKAIGGDYFGNREGRLPKAAKRKYFEADLNYNCGRRGADRLIYSSDGLIFTTKDHYKTFQKR